MLFHSKFRVDDDDHDRAVKILEHYCTKYSGKYLICLETAEISGKLHLQGWVSHHTSDDPVSSDNTYRKHMSRKYRELDCHGKAFTPVPNQDLSPCISYIVNNDNKEDIHLGSPNLFTNYTDEEFADFKLLPRHIKREEFLSQRTHKKKPKDWYDTLFDAIEEQTILNDGFIDYHGSMALYFANPPRYTNPQRANDTLRSMFLKLENLYPKNRRCHALMKVKMVNLEEQLYEPTIMIYN